MAEFDAEVASEETDLTEPGGARPKRAAEKSSKDNRRTQGPVTDRQALPQTGHVPGSVSSEPLDAEGIELDAQKGKASVRNCPRWMHHRKGVYCKTCGRVA